MASPLFADSAPVVWLFSLTPEGLVFGLLSVVHPAVSIPIKTQTVHLEKIMCIAPFIVIPPVK
ncbi:MAG: hypothetical protein KBF68_07585 [Nitrosomonas sp.]|nr:hypothetical protein [Nitrosomonas sp.]MBP9101221.1 hypothetical protein [Nitrosomonas sp.]